MRTFEGGTFEKLAFETRQSGRDVEGLKGFGEGGNLRTTVITRYIDLGVIPSNKTVESLQPVRTCVRLH